MSRSSSEWNDLVAQRLARFGSVFIPYPRHVEMHSRCDFLQQLGRRTKGQPQKGLRVLAPTGSGKSTAADAFIRLTEAKRPKTGDFIPIIKIELERHTTSRKLMMAILDAFGDPYASYGNELVLKRRVLACFERFGTELLIIDEVQHLNYLSGPRNDVTDALKGLLDAGVVPMVFLGTEDASKMFGRNLQFNGRLLPPCDLKPLDPSCDADRVLFALFVAKLERVVVDQQVLPQASDFNAAGALPALFEVSNGVIGRVSRLFHAALEVAIRRDAVRLEIEDLSWAIDHWAVEQSFVKHNPLRTARHGGR